MTEPPPSRPKPPWWQLHLWQITPLRDVLWVLLGLSVLWFAYYLRGITTPVLLALVLAYLFHPLTNWLQRRVRMSRGLAVTVLMVALGLGVGGVGAWLGPKVVKQGTSLYRYFTRPAPASMEFAVAATSIGPAQVLALGVGGGGAWLGPMVVQQGSALYRHSTRPTPASMERADRGAPELDPAPAPGPPPADQARDEQPTPDGEPAPNAETAEAAEDDDDEWKRDVPAFFHERLQLWFQRFQEDPTEQLMSNARLLLTGTSHAAVVVSSIMGTTTYLIVATTLFIIFFVVFLMWMEEIFVYAQQFIPVKRRERVFHVLRQMDDLVSAFFRGRVVVGLLLGVLLAVGWRVAGVPYWLVLGLLGGLLSIIPYAAILVWVLAVALTWLAETSGVGPAGFDFWTVLFWPSMVFAGAQLIEGWLLTPWIQGRSVGMHAATVLLVVVIGGVIGGLFGLLLAVPIAGCLKILFQEVALPRVRQWAAER